MLGSMEVADFKALNPYVTLVVNREHALSAIGGKVLCLKNRVFAGITRESDESITCVAGDIDADQFFVDSAAHVDCAARPRCVRGVLNRTPRCNLGSWIRITSGRSYVVRGIDLAQRRYPV